MPSLLILGGGIIGAGVARDAALRGCQVTLIEKGQVGEGTSSRSSKLIHGGIRYLEQGNFHLVREALRERGLLLQLAPTLVHQLPFLFVIDRYNWWQWLRVGVGVSLYRMLAGKRSLGPHHPLSFAALCRREPLLQHAPLLGGALYQDAAGDDLGLVKANISAARAAGARILEQTRASCRLDPTGVTAILPDGSSIRADVLVLAVGPWTDSVRAESGLPSRRLVSGTKGIHIAFPLSRIPLQHALALRHPRDARVMFCIPDPEREQVYFGTTDTETDQSPDQLTVEPESVEYLLEAARHLFPRLQLRGEEIIASWVGLRPLLRSSGNASSRSREHLLVREGRALTLVGGKLTTYRSMAEEAVDQVGKLLRIHLPVSRTAAIPLPRATSTIPGSSTASEQSSQ